MKKRKPKQMYSPREIAKIQQHDYSHMDEGIRAIVKTLIETELKPFNRVKAVKVTATLSRLWSFAADMKPDSAHSQLREPSA